jgi:hypothetical protein
MSATPASRGPRPACPACGLRVGVYEPLWHVVAETGAERTAWLRLAGDAGSQAAFEGVLWHAECAERVGIPGG